MKQIIPFFFAIVLVIAGCKPEFSPLVSGEVRVAGNETSTLLNMEQIKELQAWLEKSQYGWGRCYFTPPGPSVSVILHHADGSKSSVSLLRYQSSQKQTMLEASHPSGSSLSDQPCAFQRFSESDIASFKSIIGVPP